MTTDYEKQLEEEIISLKNLLDERTKELDEAKKEIESWRLGVKQFDISSSLASRNTLALKPDVCIDGERLTAQDLANFKHLWSLHMQKVNNPPLHYRIWRKIVSCLTTKKN